MNKNNLISAISEGVGNPIFLVGSSTGRDGSWATLHLKS